MICQNFPTTVFRVQNFSHLHPFTLAPASSLYYVPDTNALVKGYSHYVVTTYIFLYFIEYSQYRNALQIKVIICRCLYLRHVPVH